MRALITGASSGIGRDIARVLSNKGYDLILVARRKDKLEALKAELKTNVDIYTYDLSSTYNCNRLYERVKKDEIDILVNNAGFGLAGNFYRTNLDKELDMIDLNIKTVHILTKLFLADFVKRDKGYILNVSSLTAPIPGPMMATYYATKAYEYNLTTAIYEELRNKNSHVSISILCPGPARTEFNKNAKVQFKNPLLSSKDIASYAVKQMFNNKLVIIPSLRYRLLRTILNLLSLKQRLKYMYSFQKEKR